MAMNMGYCRFQNTLQALKECYEHMEDDDLSSEESKSRLKLIRLCSQIEADYAEGLIQ